MKTNKRNARVARAKENIVSLVQQGARLNPDVVTSATYRNAVAKLGTGKERRMAIASVDAQARSGTGKDRPMRKPKGR